MMKKLRDLSKILMENTSDPLRMASDKAKESTSG